MNTTRKPRDERVTVYLTAAERRKAEAAAIKMGVALATWLRLKAFETTK